MKKKALFCFLLLVSGVCFSQNKDLIYCNRQFFIAQPVPEHVQSRMIGKSLPKGAVTRIEDLRYLTLPYYDFEGQIQIGEMVCHKRIAHDLLVIFSTLFRAEYPIYSIRLVDDFDGDDDASMKANNTSCFNYRTVRGTNHLSRHAYGLAVDVNPLQNPWVVGKTVYPPTAAEYADRSKDFPHKIDKNDLCYKVFISRGFLWGGIWIGSRDYQHFQK